MADYDRGQGLIKRINSLLQIDTETGEVSPMYESIFSEMKIYYFQVSPDGETAVFHGMQKAEAGLRTLSILHNVLGETDEK